MSEPKRDPGWLRRWWPAFVAGALLAFAVPEGIALAAPGDGGTLSEMTREWLGMGQGQATVGWWALTAMLVAFAVWMPVHLLKGWPWEKSRKRQDDDKVE